MANRYKELISRLPKGSFYDSAGVILPYRGNNPHEFLFAPVTASRTFGIFVNGSFQGTTTSDAGGTAIVRLILDQGRQDIVLIDEVTDDRFPIYVDARVTATIMAAHAEAIETIDASLDEVQDSLTLETATSRYAGDVYGRMVQQPDDLTNWLLGSYRRLLRWLRQGFRTYGSKLLGLRQVVSGYTSSLPFRVPLAWRPRWVPATQLMPNAEMQEHTIQTASPLTNLNSVSVDCVHANFAGAVTIFPGPFTDPPTAQPLQVTFYTGWDGGSVTVAGADPLGNALVEIFTPLGAQPLAADEVVDGVENYAEVSSATKGASTGGSAAIGVRDGRFIKIVSFGPLSVPGASRTLTFQSPQVLVWGAGGAVSDVPVDVSATSPYLVDGKGTITLRSPDQPPRWFSYLHDGGGGYAVGNEHFLALEADDLGVVLIDLTDTLFGGGASPRTVAQVATSINTYFERDTRYGAVQAEGSVTCSDGATTLGAAQTLTLDDGVNPALTFEFLAAGPAAGGNVLVLLTGAETASEVATKLATAINRGSNDGAGATPSALGLLRMTAAPNVSGLGQVRIVNDFGGTQGNQVIAQAGGTITINSNMVGGLNASPYDIIASDELDLNSLQYVVRLYMASTSAQFGPSATIRVHPTGADAALTAFGVPLARSTLNGTAAMRDVTLPLPAPSSALRFAAFTETVELVPAFPDGTTTIISGPFTLTRPGPVEVVFGAGWRDQDITVIGTAYGETVYEVFEAPDLTVKSGTVVGGTSVSSADGITVTSAVPTFDANDVGRFLRLNSGALVESGAYIESVYDASTAILTSTGVGAAFAAASWTMSEQQVVQGAVVFGEIDQVSHPLYATAGPAEGLATVLVADAVQRGYNVRVGRGLRLNGGAGATITPETNESTAVFATGSPSVLFLKSDVGGYILIQGSSAGDGTNDGLHKILAVLPAGGGTTECLIRHQDADRNAIFATETLTAGTWRLYAPGEVVRVIAKHATNGDLTLYPPGVIYPHGSGELVELADEMPITAAGWEGIEEITVEVDRDYVPTTLPQSDSLALVGTKIPDGWRAYNFNSALAIGMQAPAQLGPARLLILGTTTDVDSISAQFAIERALPTTVVETYRGFVLRVSFWLQQHDSASADFGIYFDVNGAGFILGDAVVGSLSASPEAVPGTGAWYSGGGGPFDVHLVEAQYELPYDATSCVIRLVMGAGVAPAIPGAALSIEKCVVRAVNAQGLFLGTNTTPRSAKRAQFGEILYVWSPEELTAAEKLAIGVPDAPASTPTKPGQIDRVANAHGYWERFDVSEYTGGVPVNVLGAYDEVTWGAATLSNMELVVGSPPRMAVVRPIKISLVEGEPLAITAPSNATLSEASAHEGAFPEESFTDERLYEDGLPVPATPAITGGVLPWRFTAADAIEIASVGAGDPLAEAVFDAGADYTIDYRRLTRATTGVIDLGVNYRNYLWLVDTAIYRRDEPGALEFTRTQQLTFLANYQATLTVHSDEDKATTTLVADTGFSRAEVAAANWRYIDARTIEIDGGVFNSEALYSLTYTALEPQYTRLPLGTDLAAAATVVLEIRSGASSIACLAASWEAATPDMVANRAHQFHQIRATISGVTNAQVESGSGTCDVTNNVVTLTTGSFGAGVLLDRIFRINSGAGAGRAAHITRVEAARLVLDTDLGVFTNVDWEVRTFLHGVDVEIAGLGLRGINLDGSPPYAPGIIIP